MLTDQEAKLLHVAAEAGEPKSIFDVVEAVADNPCGAERDLMVQSFLDLAMAGYVAEVVPPGEETGDHYVPTDRGLAALRQATQGDPDT